MAVADATAYDAATKEVFHPDALEKQFYAEDPTLDQLEKRQPAIEIGDTCVTPVQLERAGGYSAVPRTGSDALNAADAVGMARATWNYSHHVKQCRIESATVDETRGNAKAVAEVVTTEAEGAMDTLRKNITRQIFSNGDGLIALTEGTATSATIELAASGYGYDAIVRGWLYEGMAVDIGTTSNEGSIVADAIITAVKEDSSDPDIILDQSVTLSGTTYVSVANARSGTTSYECNGFRNMFGSTSTVLGGLDPATYTRWKPAYVGSATSLTLPVIYRQGREVKQRTGKMPDWVLTSLKQGEAAFKLLQPQIRFTGSEPVNAGDSQSFTVPGVGKVDSVPDCPDRSWFSLSKKNLFMVRTKKPHWQDEYTGGNIWEWAQGTTRLASALFYRVQLATDRRNAHASEPALTD